MAVYLESIEFGKGQSLRFLSWNESVERVRLHTAAGEYEEIDGAGTLWHRHPEVEITLVTMGAGLRMVGDDVGRIGKGEVALIGRNLPHFWRMSSVSAGYCLQFDPFQAGGIWQSPEFGVLSGLWSRAQRGLLISGGLAEELQRRVAGLAGVSRLRRLAQLLEALELVARAGEEDVRPLASGEFRIPEAGDPRWEVVAEAIELISKGFRDQLRLEDVLSGLPVSRATFARHFKRGTGKSFSTFLAELRVGNACQLLATTKRGVSEIAFESGFNDLPHFNRTFRRLKGMNPRQWREGDGG
ncbi:MAG: AraC-like DNA-binding protein [Akkermansiaceae bacterium]|jgi:AraC-like DNA-binding protein